MSTDVTVAPTRDKRPSMRGAINAMCRECIYDPLSGCGTWRQQVEGCTSPNCPLFPLRPLSAGSSSEASDGTE